MRPVPFWKLKRELVRFGRQITAVPSAVLGLIFAAPYYDWKYGKSVRTFEGAVPEAGRIAIYLIFPRKGVLPSHLYALRWLKEKGVAPLVVSNLPLSQTDLEALRPLTWRIVQRPNVGYDFGGYREGVLSVQDRLQDLEQLLFLNDSAWFPLPGAKDWLEQVAELDVDFAGAATNYGIHRSQPEMFMEQEWTYHSGHRSFHYTSYALAIGPAILQDRRFWRFFRSFPMSDSKKRTVRRGEIGLSQWVIRHGFTHAPTFDLSRLDVDLADLPHDRLRYIADRIMVPEDPNLEALKHKILESDPDSTTLVRFILMATARMGMSYALQIYTIEECGFAFLKKSPLWLNPESRDITLGIAARLAGEPGRLIEAEAKALAKP
jgi:lipopolysaccharide biosynthesis protein